MVEYKVHHLTVSKYFSIFLAVNWYIDLFQGCCLLLWNLNFRFSIIRTSITLAQVFCDNFYLLNFKDRICTDLISTKFASKLKLDKQDDGFKSPLSNGLTKVLVQMGFIGAFDCWNGFEMVWVWMSMGDLCKRNHACGLFFSLRL